MVCADKNIVVEFDENSGYTKAIYYPDDEFYMNWILENSDWGHVTGFERYRTKTVKNGIDVYSESGSLSLIIEKRAEAGYYTEKYRITNHGVSEFFFTKDTLGFRFPYNCTFEGKKNLHDTSCITHVWCGGDAAWMYSAKPSGAKPYLVGYLTEGSISDYSIRYDVSRVRVGASYRGAIELLPGSMILTPGESLTFSFVFFFTDQTPDSGRVDPYHRLNVSADRYSAFAHEKISCRLDSFDPLNQPEVLCDGKIPDCTKNGRQAEWELAFDTPGERTVHVTANGRKTWMKLNVLPSLDEILVRRAEFITQKQQYHREGSRLDGAYLIYDRDEDGLFYDEAFADSNACRERIAMGVVAAQALQKHPDEYRMRSLQKHRRFVEREVFDKDTATVYNGVNRDDRWKRAYNYPWMSVYYLEWYLLTGDTECLEYAARILISYYENVGGGRQESPCIRTLEICGYLEAEGLYALRDRLIGHTTAHAERIIRDGSKCFSEEVKCTQFMFNGKINILCQTFLLTGKSEYLKLVPDFIEKSNAFSAGQPDYHLNGIAVRYWDLYWFGKSKTYGDSMPQWLSVLTAETYDYLYRTGFGNDYRRLSENIVKNNLCVFFPDGFASAGYLVPYKIVRFSSDPQYENACMKPGVSYGHHYDSFANDQDWALYFADKLLMPHT